MSTTASLMTFAEFEQLPDPEAGKQELIAGEVILMPPAQRIHSIIVRRIQRFLESHSDLNRELVFGDGTGYRIGADNWLTPDVSVQWPEQQYDEKYFLGSPRIAIEVLSPEKRKLPLKITGYFEGGAQEVWVFDPDGRTLTAHVRRGDEILWNTFRRRYSSEAAGITIELDEIFN